MIQYKKLFLLFLGGTIGLRSLLLMYHNGQIGGVSTVKTCIYFVLLPGSSWKGVPLFPVYWFVLFVKKDFKIIIVNTVLYGRWTRTDLFCVRVLYYIIRTSRFSFTSLLVFLLLYVRSSYKGWIVKYVWKRPISTLLQPRHRYF